MSPSVSFLTPILLLPLLNCGGSQHDVQEKYFLVSANIKVPYWQEAAASIFLPFIGMAFNGKHSNCR